MATAPEYTPTTGTDLTDLQTLLAGIDEDSLVTGIQQMGADKSKTLKIGPKGREIFVRILPKLVDHWLQVVNFCASTPSPEIKKRASSEFATAFKDGNLIIETKVGKKRIAYASKDAADKIRTGQLNLRNPTNGNTGQYDDIKVIETQDFEMISNTLMTQMQQPGENQAALSSQDVTKIQDTAKTAQTTPPSHISVKPPHAPSKEVPITPQPKKKTKTDAEVGAEALRKEEKEIEAERVKKDEEETEEQKVHREKVITEVDETKKDEIKKAEEITSEDQGSSVPP